MPAPVAVDLRPGLCDPAVRSYWLHANGRCCLVKRIAAGGWSVTLRRIDALGFVVLASRRFREEWRAKSRARAALGLYPCDTAA